MTERFWTWLAWKLPRGLAYWATVRVATWNFNGNPGDRTVLNVLEGWDKGTRG